MGIGPGQNLWDRQLGTMSEVLGASPLDQEL